MRRRYLLALHEHTGHNIILYASQWTQPGADPNLVSINDEDLQGLMEVVHGLPTKPLDLILHSPGGSPEAAEMLVQYLRSKFPIIRAIVPQAAMSAATMMAYAANSVVMGKHSALGPVDPQFIFRGPAGSHFVPAQAILDQFSLAEDRCSDPKKLGAWVPMLGQYGPALLVQCKNAVDLAESLVKDWLGRWMFKDFADAGERAEAAANLLANHTHFKSHARHITRAVAEELGLVIEHLEDDQRLQDLALSAFHATTHVFSATPAVKIIENHLGKAFVKQERQAVQMPIPIVPPQPPTPPRPT